MHRTTRLILIFSLIFSARGMLAQTSVSPYYVVIGAFSTEENAERFCAYAHDENLPAVYAYNAGRKIFYVYVRVTPTRKVAHETRDNLRSSSVFRDAWVFNGVLSGGTAPAARPAPVVEPPQDVEPQVTPEAPRVAVIAAEAEPVAAENQASVDAEGSNSAPQAPKPVGKPFFFKLINGETGARVNGLVRLQEADRAQQFRGVNGNEIVYVPAPSNRSGKWFIVCHVLGFRRYKKPVAYENPTDFDGASVGAEEEVVIPLALERVRRGDYIEMDGVKFFNNAALFAPGSEQQLDELIAMMEENPDYNIRLHGHTNGNQSRDIVSIGESTDYFAPHLSNAKAHASAKELSLLRAELVKSYLVSKGIAAGRISTKGEGGRQMIFDPRGTLAAMNDRVEVEIRKH